MFPATGDAMGQKTTLKGLSAGGIFPSCGAPATDVWPAGDLKRKLALGKQKGICFKVRKSSGSLWIKERASETNRGWVWEGVEHLYDAGWRGRQILVLLREDWNDIQRAHRSQDFGRSITITWRKKSRCIKVN